MRRVAGFAAAAVTLVAAQLAGTFAVQALHMPIPGAVAGLLVLLAGLGMWRQLPDALDQVAGLLLRHLNLFFVPAGVGLMAHLALLARDGAALAVAITLSTLAGLIVAAIVFVQASRRLSAGAAQGDRR